MYAQLSNKSQFYFWKCNFSGKCHMQCCAVMQFRNEINYIKSNDLSWLFFHLPPRHIRHCACNANHPCQCNPNNVQWEQSRQSPRPAKSAGQCGRYWSADVLATYVICLKLTFFITLFEKVSVLVCCVFQVVYVCESFN